MRHTFAGLGASREEVEKLFMRDRSRESLIVRPRVTKFGLPHVPGRFTWDAKNVFFDFYGQGKQRRITLLRGEVEEVAHRYVGAVDEEGERQSGSFAPAETRWRGRITRFPGTQHRTAIGGETKMWERAAWNTINSWCLPKRMAHTAPLVEVMKTAAQAWARVTDDFKTVWFLPHEQGARREVVVKDVDGNRKYQKFFVVIANTSSAYAMVSEPEWWNLKGASQEQLNYLAVAYDQWEESGGKSFAPLQGLKRTERIPASAVAYAMKKLDRKVKRCSITPAMMREGMKVELEHRDVTQGGVEKTARIAAEHMCERRGYYKRLTRKVGRL